MSNMNNQVDWAETAANRSRACWGDFISSRVDVAMEQISRNPEYREMQDYQRKTEKEIDAILEKLSEEERDAIKRYHERQTTLENYELEETYMLGVKDGIRFLSWLDIFQAKEWVYRRNMRGIFTMMKVIESNRLKKKTCDRCIERLKDTLNAEQIRKFEEAFYSASDGYLFSERKR